MSKNKVGRNQPCLCGSGIKHKLCCLKRVREQIEREEKVRRAINDYDKKKREEKEREKEVIQRSIEKS